ncbi:hypothetical protein [Humibacter ginsengiterrae]
MKMDGVGGRFSSALKIALGALGVTGGLLLLALVFGAHSASAETPTTSSPSASQPVASQPSGTTPATGLLSTVGFTLNAVTAPVTSTVGSIPASTSRIVAPTVETVIHAAPTSVQQLVQPVAQTMDATTGTISASGTLEPVANAVDGIVSSVPVVGGTLHATLGTLSSVTTPLAGTVDGVLSSVDATTASVTEAAMPASTSASSPIEFMSTGAADVSRSADAAAAIGSLASSPLVDRTLESAGNFGLTSTSNAPEPSTPVPSTPTSPPGATGQPTTLRSGGGSAGTALAGVLGLSGPAPLTSHSTASASDDDLPSMPTYDTDCSPD